LDQSFACLFVASFLFFSTMGNSCKAAGAGPVQNAWDNHFSAFGTQDLDKILLDYTAKSVITVYDQSTGTKTVHTGLEGARACFEGLFKSLSDISDLDAPVQIVKEARKHEPGSVFLIWRCPASGFVEATDTFIFDKSSKIRRQNVVITFKDPKGDGSDVAKNDAEVPTGSGRVHKGWANHFKAFGDQDVAMILKDYVAESEITVYNHADGTTNIFNGLEGARSCFEGLFKSLHDCSDLAAPIIHVEEAKSRVPGIGSASYGQVFLVWSCPASGYHRATDTFIFNSKGKIIRQNVVLHYAPEPSPEEAAHTLVAQVLATALTQNQSPEKAAHTLVAQVLATALKDFSGVGENQSPEEAAHTLVAQALATALKDFSGVDKNQSPEEAAHTLVAQVLVNALEKQGDSDKGWAGKDLDKGWGSRGVDKGWPSRRRRFECAGSIGAEKEAVCGGIRAGPMPQVWVAARRT
jgi:hypothetical protein